MKVKLNKLCKCGKILKRPDRNKYCWSCYCLQLKNPKHHPCWDGGREKRKVYCIDCNKILPISAYYSGGKRCLKCLFIFRRGKNSSHYIDGRSTKIYKCKECHRVVGWQTAIYGENRCHYCSRLGERSNLYIDGKGYEPYPKEFNINLKKLIRNRDKYKCQICNKPGKFIHHINYNKKDLNNNNLITLCRKCHSATNSNRDYWYAYFTYLLGVCND